MPVSYLPIKLNLAEAPLQLFHNIGFAIYKDAQIRMGKTEILRRLT